MFLLTIFPIAAAAWAFHTKIVERKYYDLTLMALLALAVIVNVVMIYHCIFEDIPVAWQMVQIAAASTIVPLNYMYFARQVGTRRSNRLAIYLMWALAALSLIPNIVIYNPFEPFIYPESGFKPFIIYYITHGEKAFIMGVGDLMVIIQTIIVIMRIIPFMLMLRRHNLHLNHKVYAFSIFWAVTIIFIIITANILYEDLRHPVAMWLFFIAYSLLIVAMNVLIALHYDSYPVETEQGEVIENVEVYVDNQFIDMSKRMSTMVMEQQLYRNPNFTSEAMIEMLNTNRTYFAKMMTKVFGMTFSEYLNSIRFERIKQLLNDPSLQMTDIAVQSGFNDPSYMARKFKEKYGVTPYMWRKRNIQIGNSN